MFEFKGIPCRHLLLVLRITRFNDLLPIYILKRCCKDAKKGTIIDSVGNEIIVRSRDPQSTRFRELRYDFDKLAEQGCASEENFELMKKLIPKWRDEYEGLASSNSVNHNNSNEEEVDVDKERQPVDSLSTVNKVNFVNEPSQCRPKGCGERLKTRMEKIMGKPRLCRACGKRGVQHDSRNCPDKRKWYVVSGCLIYILQENRMHDLAYLILFQGERERGG